MFTAKCNFSTVCLWCLIWKGKKKRPCRVVCRFARSLTRYYENVWAGEDLNPQILRICEELKKKNVYVLVHIIIIITTSRPPSEIIVLTRRKIMRQFYSVFKFELLHIYMYTLIIIISKNTQNFFFDVT